ncbi:MAG: LamG-like jellyroll fold domain-containing protein, partial [Thermoguttaceae bacterium]
GLANCRWANARDALTDATAVSQGRKCTLLSGMMEITYRSGARVILEGPCDYQVDPAGGYLRLGKLTARVEKSEKRNPKSENRSPLSPLPSPLFTVRTPTATVTDLGTEFGVEVDARGDAAAHVLQGKIEVRPAVGDRGAPAKHGDASDVAGNRPIRLVVGQSVRVVKDADGHKLHSVPGKADAAAFPARPGHLAEYVQQQRSGLFRRWQAYSEELRKRGDLLAYYDFQPDTGEPLAVRNRAATGHAFDGWIRGGNWGVGSLPGKWAVRCTKPGDGVHVELSAKCRQITMALWLRVDALPKDEDREFGLLMSDGWSGSGRTHWTIRRDGTVWLSFTGLPTGDAGNLGQSSVTVGKNDLGRWRFLAVASDLAQGKTRFYVDGALAAEKAFAASDSAEFDIGPAMIGNWNDMGQPPADNRVLSGCVEEAMLFRTTLSEKEIHWLFRRGGLSRDGGNSATPDKPVESLGAK